MLGSKCTVVVVQRLEPEPQLDTGSLEYALERRNRGLPRTGFDPGDDRLRYARPLSELALGQIRPSSSKAHEVGGNGALDRDVHGPNDT